MHQEYHLRLEKQKFFEVSGREQDAVAISVYLSNQARCPAPTRPTSTQPSALFRSGEFQHRRIHKETWLSPDGRTKNQIHNVLVNSKWRRSLEDVVVRRGANVNNNHNLLLAVVPLLVTKNDNCARIKQMILFRHFD